MCGRKKKRRTGLASDLRVITVFSSPRERHRGLLRCGPLQLPCALGRSGLMHLKREGDGATPAGRMRLLSLVLRPDRGPPPVSALPSCVMRPNDGWCEDKTSGRYNRPIRLPATDGHETMWRADHLYDMVGIFDWNLSPRIRGRGSAIFLHLARPGYGPTAGCIALSRRDLRLLLAAAGPRPVFVVGDKPRRHGARKINRSANA
jgi:L,D-peptidoglycan transpeptidase YkuD (ErfK/YbiS/YcfS/YnhG family)